MKPILFNTAMVRAILDGRKTVTRRVIKQQPIDVGDCKHELQTFREMIPEYYPDDYSAACRKCGYGVCPSGESIYKPPYIPGDILYVRETWGYDKNNWLYKADFTPADLDRIASITRWRPSIHMPKEAARIFLRVTKVGVERLQNITDESCESEGIRAWTKDGRLYKYAPADAEGDAPCWKWADTPRSAKEAMQKLWDSTIPKHPNKFKRYPYYWDDNPWVWVIEFEKYQPEGDVFPEDSKMKGGESDA